MDVHNFSLGSCQQKFPLGCIVITANARQRLQPNEAERALTRHAAGDWGNLCNEDRRQNASALNNGSRLFSAYQAEDSTKFWIITEADRSVTTILLPLDY
jgi:hypothetical protein